MCILYYFPPVYVVLTVKVCENKYYNLLYFNYTGIHCDKKTLRKIGWKERKTRKTVQMV